MASRLHLLAHSPVLAASRKHLLSGWAEVKVSSCALNQICLVGLQQSRPVSLLRRCIRSIGLGVHRLCHRFRKTNAYRSFMKSARLWVCHVSSPSLERVHSRLHSRRSLIFCADLPCLTRIGLQFPFVYVLWCLVLYVWLREDCQPWKGQDRVEASHMKHRTDICAPFLCLSDTDTGETRTP